MNTSNSFFQEYFHLVHKQLNSVSAQDLEDVAHLIRLAGRNRKKVIIVGNGGSAAMASHVAVDFTKAAGIRAINFNEADLITCFANDYGYECWVEKALEFYADEGDVVILISSSGKSPNILNGAFKSKKMGLPLITFSGFESDNVLRQIGNYNFWVDSKGYNIVEMTHHVWLVALIDFIIGKIEYKA